MPDTWAIMEEEIRTHPPLEPAPNKTDYGLHISICTGGKERDIHNNCAPGNRRMTKEKKKRGGRATLAHTKKLAYLRKRSSLFFKKREMAPELCPRKGYHIGGNNKSDTERKKNGNWQIFPIFFVEGEKGVTHHARIPVDQDHSFSKEDASSDDWHAVFVFDWNANTLDDCFAPVSS